MNQYMRALEHAVPERFFNDPVTCNLAGVPIPILGLPTCPEGISAAKVLSLAAHTGQKKFSITPQLYSTNPSSARIRLDAHSTDTKNRVQNYLDALLEVIVHEAPISQSGWTKLALEGVDADCYVGGFGVGLGAIRLFDIGNILGKIVGIIGVLMGILVDGTSARTRRKM